MLINTRELMRRKVAGQPREQIEREMKVSAKNYDIVTTSVMFIAVEKRMRAGTECASIKAKDAIA